MCVLGQPEPVGSVLTFPSGYDILEYSWVKATAVSVRLRILFVMLQNTNKHKLMNGMDSSYTRWIHHGESLNVDITNHAIAVHDAIDVDGVTEEYNYGADPWEEVLANLHTAKQARHNEENQDGDVEPHKQDSF